MGRRATDDPHDHPICVRFTKAEKREVLEWVGPANRSEKIRGAILAAARADAESSADQ